MSKVYLSPPDLSEADHCAVARALESNWVAPVGPELAGFEKEVCEGTGRSNGVAVNSGTAALHLALQLMEVGEGDVVLCSAFTFAASANPITYCGAKPIFIGSEAGRWNMDPNALEAALASLKKENIKPKAIILVQLYGQCAEMEAIEAICSTYDVPIIEDAAEALGATYKGRAAGSFGDCSFFSFNGNKIITTSGGGMLLSNNEAWIQRATYLATQARQPVLHYEHTDIGYNYRMSNILAALGRSQYEALADKISKRRTHFEAYRDALKDLPGVSFMPIAEVDGCNYWLSCLTVDFSESKVSKDSLIKALEAEGIESRPLWKPLQLQPVFESCRYFGSRVEEKLFAEGLCLPSGSSLQIKEREKIQSVIRSCFKI